MRSKRKAPAFADAERSRTRTTTRTRTIGEAEDGNQDPRWRVPSASKRSINRVNIATTRVWLFLLASSASPIVFVVVVVLVLDLFAFRSRLEEQPSLRGEDRLPFPYVVSTRTTLSVPQSRYNRARIGAPFGHVTNHALYSGGRNHLALFVLSTSMARASST